MIAGDKKVLVMRTNMDHLVCCPANTAAGHGSTPRIATWRAPYAMV
jgi:hypothetical protein